MIWISLLSLLCGALLPLSFAPFNIYSIAFIIPAILLFILMQQKKPKSAFWLGWLFGLGFFGTGTSWVYISIHHFGNANAPLAVLITFLLCAFLALFFGFQSYVFRKFFSRCRDSKNCLLVFPALWVVFEYLRSTVLTGFPWILLGYSQSTTPLHALAPIIGIYGLSLITTAISGALVLLATKQSSAAKIISMIVVFVPIGAGFVIEDHAWTKPIGNTITVSLIQGNIPQAVKWDASYAMQNINVYKHLTFDNFSSQLIVWPEGAFPVFANQAAGFIQKLGMLAKKHHSNIIFGVPILDQKKYYNGLLLIGENQGQYLKKHLVPFGEYTPFETLFKKAMGYFQIPMSNFSEGPVIQAPLMVNGIRIAPFICYEIAFPIDVLNAAKHNEVLMTLSDDSWFGKSIALTQHLQMAQMRSLETGRPQLLDTNTGITAFISPLGKVTVGAPIDKRLVITSNIQPMHGHTPLMRFGYYPIAGLIVIMLIAAIFL